MVSYTIKSLDKRLPIQIVINFYSIVFSDLPYLRYPEKLEGDIDKKNLFVQVHYPEG